MKLQWWEYLYIDVYSERTVRIAKVGGGTPGESYEGQWEFEVVNPEGEVIQKSYLTTGTPKTHIEACREILSFHEEI